MEKINLRKKHDYWSDRFSQLEAARNEANIQKIHEIDEQFRKSLAVLDERIRAWFQRFADNNGVSPQEAYKMLNGDELDELRWTLEEYIRFGRENAEGQQWIKELENASAKIHIRRLEALKAEVLAEMEKMYQGVSDDIDEHIKKTYTDEFYRAAYELQKGTGIGHRLEALNPEKVQMIVSKPWAVDGRNFSERLWGNKEQLINTVYQILSRMVITGNNPDRAIRELSKAYGVSKSQAGNLVMTESAVMGNLAQKKSFEEHDVEEFEVIETLDSKTCSVCGKYDGAHYPMKRFEIGVTAPPFHPRCRGCTAPYYPDWVYKGERVARDKDGNKYRVPGDMTYEEWKEKYVDAESESSKRKHYLDRLIAAPKTQTQEYRERFKALGETLGVTREIYKCAQDMLKHRSGTEYEDLAFICTDKKKKLVNENCNIPLKCWATQKMKALINTSEEYSVIGMHNHPYSTFPGYDDLKQAKNRKYKFGLVVGHDGSIFKYSVDKKADLDNAAICLASLESLIYNGDEAKRIKDAYARLRNYGVVFEVIP